jgi:hypothetical protein
VASIFWGLWLIPFALLVIRSGFIPPVIGWLQIAAGIGYLVDSSVGIVLPQYTAAVGRVTFILLFGELPGILYLLIWGARTRPDAAGAIRAT